MTTAATAMLLSAGALLSWGCAVSTDSGSRGSGTGGAAVGNAGSGGASAVGGSGGAAVGAPVGGSGGGGATDGPAAGADGAGSVPDADPPPLQECTTPSIDRIESFIASGEGTTVPMSGTLLVRDGARYVAKEQFLKAEWHVMAVWIGNTFNASVDLSTSKGFTLIWSSTGDLYIQMRPAFHYDGGAQWVTLVPNTNGQVRTQFFPFDAGSWTTISLGTPTWSYAMARAAVRGLLFVGQTANVIAISGLRIDGYVPPCM